MSKVQRVALPPKASSLVESMRSMGYTLQTALADIIDNSIAAGATKIDIFADTSLESAAIAIVDNGSGMSRKTLLEAMRPGSRSPLGVREIHDLGRFGLGLKTASFSQARRLTVFTRKQGAATAAIWDLDEVVRSDNWEITIPSDFESVRWSDRLFGDGTIVLWESPDRFREGDGTAANHIMVRKLDQAADHLELVFHRYLTGEKGLQKVRIGMNGRDLVPFDPFNSGHSATIRGSEDAFQLGDNTISITPFTLPHHSKLSPAEWERFGGPEGYIRNQGFYLYRQKRLIIRSTWFGLAKQTDATKLARVRIDTPSSLDADWNIDIRKASAQPPGPVRERLRRIVETIGASSKRIYMSRGAKRTSGEAIPVWQKRQKEGAISFALNESHPLVVSLCERLGYEDAAELRRLLGVISGTIPIEAIHADIGNNPNNVSTYELSDDDFRAAVLSMDEALANAGVGRSSRRTMMASSEPFRSREDLLVKILKSMEEQSQC